jgi:hypothetical protein
MDKVAVHECVLEHGHDRVYVVGRLQANVLKDEQECLETAHAHVQLRCAVLVQDRRDAREQPACRSDDGGGNGAADVRLALLHTQVHQQDGEHVLRTQTLGNVAERVHRRTLDTLPVCLEEIEKFETDPHPLACWHEFGTMINRHAGMYQ